MNAELEPAEREALALLIAGHADEETLRAQLAATTVVLRRNTGAGIHVELRVADTAASTVLASAAAVTGAHMVHCTIGGLFGGVMLWLHDGRLGELEAFVYDGATAPGMRIDRAWIDDSLVAKPRTEA